MSSYTVQPGDTLSKIAAKIYGAASKYPAIATANGIASPYIIRVGQVLTIPAGGVWPPAPPPLLARPSTTAAPTPSTGSLPVPFTSAGNIDFTRILTQPVPTPGVSQPPATHVPAVVAHPTGPSPAPGTHFSLSHMLSSLTQHKTLLVGGAIALVALAFVSNGGK